ncbi:MAG: hypothetical protein K9L22_12940 [Methylococcaceae bacterium]|nr:hypothetical protein [Methylococcaceae bacterium]
MDFIKYIISSCAGLTLSALKHIIIGSIALILLVFYNNLFWWLLGLWFIGGIFFTDTDTDKQE